MIGKVEVKLTPIILKENKRDELQTCSLCRDTIYGEMYRIWIEIEFGKTSPPLGKTKAFLCQSCADILNRKSK